MKPTLYFIFETGIQESFEPFEAVVTPFEKVKESPDNLVPHILLIDMVTDIVELSHHEDAHFKQGVGVARRQLLKSLARASWISKIELNFDKSFSVSSMKKLCLMMMFLKLMLVQVMLYRRFSVSSK